MLDGVTEVPAQREDLDERIRATLDAARAEVERLAAGLRDISIALGKAGEERDRIRPVVEKVRAWREAHGEDHAVTSAELAGAWDAYTAGQPAPRVWALPDEPGPEVRTVRDRNGRRWTRRPEICRWECERQLAGLQVVESWERLFRAAGPLTDATDEPAQDAARGTAGPDVGEETPDAPRGAETPDRDYCPPSQRVDGKLHSWKFDGDDPYIVCAYCGEMRDALSGETLRPGFKDGTDA